MVKQAPSNIFDLADLRERIHVFCDRDHAGRILAEMLPDEAVPGALVLGIPAGGVPVAAAMAKARCLKLDVAVVSKITLPWNTEVGYGAVAFDGTVQLNDAMLPQTGLTKVDIDTGIAATLAKVKRRVGELRKGVEHVLLLLQLGGIRSLREHDTGPAQLGLAERRPQRGRSSTGLQFRLKDVATSLVHFPAGAIHVEADEATR